MRRRTGYVLVVVILLGVGFCGYFFRETIKDYSLIVPLVSLPFSLLIGYFSYSLYRQKFLKRELA